MALTDAEREWLETDNIRVILVEVCYPGELLRLECNNNNTNELLQNIDDIYCNSTYIANIRFYIYCNSEYIVSENIVLYLSNTPYISEHEELFVNLVGEEVKNIAYDDVLETIPNLSSGIDSSSKIGNLTFYNTQAEYDYIFDKPWEGNPIKLLMGDPSWPRNTFIQVFNGITESVTAPTESTFDIAIRDKNDILAKTTESKTITTSYVSGVLGSATNFVLAVENVPTTEDPLDSIEYNPSFAVVPEGILNTRVPICIGKCFNVEPVLIDAYNHVYLIHDGPITGILEVDGIPQIRSNGVVLNGVPPTVLEDPQLQYEIDLDIGCIRLLDHPNATKITLDVEGARDRGTGYDDAVENELIKNSAAWLVEWLALEKSSLRKDDLDYETFVALDALNSSELGLFHRGEDSVSTLMQSVVYSIGSYYRFDRLSKLQLIILDDPAELPAPTITVEQDYITHQGVSLSSIEIPRSKITLAYEKNWTVIDTESLAGILAEPEGLYTQQKLSSEYQTVTAINSGVQLKYPLAETYETTETLIYSEVEAQAEVDRRAIIRNKKRFIYKIESITPPLDLSVGDTINIVYNRFGFEEGKIAVVIGLSEKLTNNRVTIEAWL